MSYVIAVCGAGGKTTICKKLAKKYASLGKSVCITTTTNMWYDDDVKENFYKGEHCEPGKIYYTGIVDESSCKLKPLTVEDYYKLCDKFDYVIVEADGSRMMPLKIPREGEPIIPDNVNEIIVTMGLHSIGREIGSVCHRFNECRNKPCENEKRMGELCEPHVIVTENIIDKLIDTYYEKPLKEKYKNVKITINKVDFKESENYKKIKKLALVLCASGFSKRFGDDNKLLASIPVNENNEYSINGIGKPLYKVMIEKLLGTKDKLLDKFHKGLSYDWLEANVAVVTQYDEILNDVNYKDKALMIKNDKADLGLSSSIKIAIDCFKDYDAIMFLNADMPKLPINEIALFLYYSILSNNGISSMYTIDPKNPAYFEKKYFDEILSIDGDKGPKSLLTKYIMNAYKYHIADDYLYDIDSKEDLEALWN